MRRVLYSLVAGWLALACSPGVLAQNASQAGPPAVPKTSPPLPASQPTPGAENLAQPEAQVSLGELARLARENKKPGTKTVKILDDDNFPRTKRPREATPSGGSPAANQGSGAFSSQSGRKLVLLDFWASWCGPCRSALPGLKRLQSFYGSDQLQVISISADDDEDVWRSFVAAHDMNWEQRLDANGSLRAQYGVNSLPTYVLLAADGKILERLVGEDPTQSIAERLGPSLRSNLGSSQ